MTPPTQFKGNPAPADEPEEKLEPKAEPEPAPLAPVAEEVAAEVAAGIEYTESFTMRDAVKSYNATREDQKNLAGEVILSAEQQRLTYDDAWFEKRKGTFTLRRPGFYDEMKLRVRFCQLTENVPVDPWTASWAHATAHAELLLAGKPKWFVLDELKDPGFVLLIYYWFQEWSARFREEDE